MDLAHSNRIKKPLDDAEHAAETPGRVDDIQFPQALGVVVLGDARRGLDVRVVVRGGRDAQALEVHDRAAGLEEVVVFTAAGGEAGVCYFFVLDDEVREHAFGCCDFVERC